MLTRYIDELYEDRAGVRNGYVFAAGRLVGRFRGGGTRHLHVDHLGSVILVTRDDGSVDGRGWFGPYGSTPEAADTESNSTWEEGGSWKGIEETVESGRGWYWISTLA